MARNRSNGASVRKGLRRGQPDREGFKSALESNVAGQLREAGIPFEYETVTLAVALPAGRTHRCTVDPTHKVGRVTVYSPDFVFPSAKLFIETKGRFDADDRQRAEAV